MKKKIGIIVGVLVLITGGTSFWLLSKPKDYSDTVTYNEATSIIEIVKKDEYKSEFEFWDIQKIEDTLFLVSYETEEVKDVYKSDHSWILMDDKVLYEVFKGNLVKGEDLDLSIASKFRHNIKTFKEEKEIEVIEFEKSEIESNRVPKGETTVYTEGEEGEKEIIDYKSYVNGKLEESKVTENIVKEPIDEVTLVGTFVEPPTPPPPPPAPDKKTSGDVTGRKLTWYNVKFNKDGSIARWANKMYGKYSFTQSGCVPTSLAIAMSGYNVNVTPDQVGDLLYSKSLYNSGGYIGTGGKGVMTGVQSYGLGINGLTSESQVHAALSRGNVVVAAVGSGKFGLGSKTLTHMIVLNGYKDGITYVTDPTYANKSSNASVSSLWANQSQDVVDRELGFVFYEITGGGYVPEDPDPEKPTEPEVPKDEFIILDELKDLTKVQVDTYLAQFGIKAIYTDTIIEVTDQNLDGHTSITTSTKGRKHNKAHKTIELSVNVYKYVAPVEPESPGDNKTE